MAFQIKDFASIAASMINWMRASTTKITDFNVGSVARTLVEAPAVEMDELYQQMLIGLREAIPVSVYNSFDFERIAAVPASGQVRINVTPPTASVVIPAGSTFTTQATQVVFTSTDDVVIPPGGSFANVSVVARDAGIAGNLPEAQAWTVLPQPEGFLSASNLIAFSNGLDEETDEQRKLRFTAYIASLNRGTLAALEYGLSTTVLRNASGAEVERVRFSAIIEPWLQDNAQPVSLVNCYIHNGVGSTSGDLVNLARDVIYGYTDAAGNKIPGWKAAGVRVEVFPATEVVLDVSGDLTVTPGFNPTAIAAAAVDALGVYILSLGIGQTFQVASAIDAVMSIDGVSNFVPADIPPPATPVLGQLAVGSLGGGTRFARITYVTTAGETLPSAEASFAVSANNVLTVASPAGRPGVVGYNVYAGNSSGSLQKQNPTPIGIGTAYEQPITGFIAGVAPPTISTSRLVDISLGPSAKFVPGSILVT